MTSVPGCPAASQAKRCTVSAWTTAILLDLADRQTSARPPETGSIASTSTPPKPITDRNK